MLFAIKNSLQFCKLLFEILLYRKVRLFYQPPPPPPPAPPPENPPPPPELLELGAE